MSANTNQVVLGMIAGLRDDLKRVSEAIEDLTLARDTLARSVESALDVVRFWADEEGDDVIVTLNGQEYAVPYVEGGPTVADLRRVARVSDSYWIGVYSWPVAPEGNDDARLIRGQAYDRIQRLGT